MNSRSMLDQYSRACTEHHLSHFWSDLLISLLMHQNRAINHIQRLLNTADILLRPFAS